MSWQNEMVRIVRYLINDLDCDSPTYSDSRLEETILIAGQLTLDEVNYEKDYTIDVDTLVLTPDPTASPKDNFFINIVSTKTACLILQGETKVATACGYVIKDGPSTIDMSNYVKGVMDLYKEMSNRYENIKLQYLAGNASAGQAVLGPYTVDFVRPIRGNFT